MKLSKTLLVILFISLLSSQSWSETIDDLVERENTLYLKFSDVPFTGKVTGRYKGSVKNGKRDGAWKEYYIDGQLFYKGNFKNGKQDGAWVRYYGNGQSWSKGNYKNDIKDGAWVYYHHNGQLMSKGNYKNGKQDGAWVSYDDDGTIKKRGTGTFKDDVKISD